MGCRLAEYLHLGGSVHGQAEVGDGGVDGAGALASLAVQHVQIHAVHALLQADVQQRLLCRRAAAALRTKSCLSCRVAPVQSAWTDRISAAGVQGLEGYGVWSGGSPRSLTAEDSRTAKYSCESASSALMRRPGSNASMRPSRCTAASPAIQDKT